MSNGPANLSVCVGDDRVCIRIAGRASFQCSADFKALINGLMAKGHTSFVLDLTECQLMDSTFLGILAGLASRCAQEPKGRPPITIGLLNPSARIKDLLENLGIAHLFKIEQGVSLPTESLNRIENNSCTTDRKETTRTCLEAHRTLMEVNPANVQKFKDVTRFLEEDLKKMEQ